MTPLTMTLPLTMTPPSPYGDFAAPSAPRRATPSFPRACATKPDAIGAARACNLSRRAIRVNANPQARPLRGRQDRESAPPPFKGCIILHHFDSFTPSVGFAVRRQ